MASRRSRLTLQGFRTYGLGDSEWERCHEQTTVECVRGAASRDCRRWLHCASAGAAAGSACTRCRVRGNTWAHGRPGHLRSIRSGSGLAEADVRKPAWTRTVDLLGDDGRVCREPEQGARRVEGRTAAHREAAGIDSGCRSLDRDFSFPSSVCRCDKRGAGSRTAISWTNRGMAGRASTGASSTASW